MGLDRADLNVRAVQRWCIVLPGGCGEAVARGSWRVAHVLLALVHRQGKLARFHGLLIIRMRQRLAAGRGG